MHPSKGKLLHLAGLLVMGFCHHSAVGMSYQVDGEVSFEGMCDASGAVPVSSTHFIVADDEDNLLRMYDAEVGGKPIASYSLAVLPNGEHVTSTHVKNDGDEFDLEAATKVNETLFWLSSHGRDSKGKARPERYQFIALSRNADTGEIAPKGKPYRALLEDIIGSPLLPDYPWQKYSHRPAKEHDAINIEGMTAALDGGILIGFRNPVVDGKSIVVRIKNPEQIASGEKAIVDQVMQIRLDGLGIRGLTSWNGDYYIAAGPIDEERESRIYKWQAGEEPRHLNVKTPADFNPEGFFTPENSERFMVLSDDGGRELAGKNCKKLKDSTAKHFRGIWIKAQSERVVSREK